MAFTFDPDLADNISKVRFHISDVDDEGHFLEDETITYLLGQYSMGETVIYAIKHILGLLARPDFKLDWMSVSSKEARDGYKDLLKEKEIEFGLSAKAVSTISQPYRADSLQNSEESTYASE